MSDMFLTSTRCTVPKERRDATSATTAPLLAGKHQTMRDGRGMNIFIVADIAEDSERGITGDYIIGKKGP